MDCLDSSLARKRSKSAMQTKLASGEKVCSKCKKVKEKAQFGPDASRLDGIRPNCRPCKAAESRLYRQKNPDVAAAATAAWAQKNPERRKAKMYRYASKVQNRIHHAISARMYAWIKGTKEGRTKEALGYGWPELKTHLERQFIDGMTWDNYGEWHIDHIVPLSSFTAQSLHDSSVKAAWALSNLRPLWASDNWRKNAKITHLI